MFGSATRRQYSAELTFFSESAPSVCLSQRRCVAFDPGGDVNAVCDVANWHLLHGAVRIQRLPHLAADLAVQFAHAVGRTRAFQRQHRHAEGLRFVFRMDAANAIKSPTGTCNCAGIFGIT